MISFDFIIAPLSYLKYVYLDPYYRTCVLLWQDSRIHKVKSRFFMRMILREERRNVLSEMREQYRHRSVLL